MLEALAIARWQMLINLIRRDRSARSDVAAKILVGLLVVIVSLSVGFGMGSIAYGTASRGRGIAALLWMVFFLWLFFQAIGAAQEGSSFREIARYPVPFRLYCVFQAAYALMDPTPLMAAFWLFCGWIGLFFAKPSLVAKSTPMMAGFWLATFLLSRLVAELVERVTMTKRGRRRLVTSMIALSFVFQFFIFGSHGFGGDPLSTYRKLQVAAPYLPPGIAANGAHGGSLVAATLGLLAYVIALGLPLLWIYHRKFQGELFSDAPARGGDTEVAPGWRFPLLSNSMAALVEKEFRYTLSQPLGWLNFGYGPFMALLTVMGMGRFFHFARELVFPFIVGWVMLMVGSRAYNCFGFDLGGFNRYMLAPPDMREVIGSKNLTVALLLISNFAGIALVLAYFAPFSRAMFFNVLLGFIVASLATLSAGNFLSPRFPMGIDLETMRAKNGSAAGQLGAIATQFLVAGALGVVFYWKLPAFAIFVCLTAVSGALYWTSLDNAACYVERNGEGIAQSLTG